MPKKRRTLDVVCLNKDCSCYGEHGLRNIVRNGKKDNGVQNYLCRNCKQQFVRTKGTIFYHKKLKKKDIENICRHIVETNSFRGIGRQTKHSKDTICSYVKLIGEHCEKINELLIYDLKLGTHEIDEFWSYVKKKKKTLMNKSNTLEIMKRGMRTHTSI